MSGPDRFASPPKSLQAERQSSLSFRWSQSPSRLQWKDMDDILAVPQAAFTLRLSLPPQWDLFHLLVSVILTVMQSSNYWIFYQCPGFFDFGMIAGLWCGYQELASSAWQSVLQPILHKGLKTGRSRILFPGPQGWQSFLFACLCLEAQGCFPLLPHHPHPLFYLFNFFSSFTGCLEIPIWNVKL